MGNRSQSFLGGALALVLCACHPNGGSGADAGDPLDVTAAPGEPIPGITADEQTRFNAGLARFTALPTVAQGFGPLYNASACDDCHGVPAIGGQGGIPVTRAGYSTPDGGFLPLDGGTLVDRYCIEPQIARAMLPADATVVTHRRTLPLFGAGLIEAIDDATLEALAARAKSFGVKGRLAHVIDPSTGQLRAGKLGWKAAHATVLSFSAQASRDELGLTNPYFPDELAPNGDRAILAQLDTVPDPELTLADEQRYANFVAFLAPPAPAPLSDDARAGEALFQTVGCAECHVPTQVTGGNASAALAHRAIAPYSDFLLHDVGIPDGVPQGDATGAEIRTPPLWGLRYRDQLLHDGSVSTPADAVERHAGEAAQALARYHALGDAERGQLLAFLAAL